MADVPTRLGEPRALILASSSPQRRAILEQLGVAFRVVVPGVEELADGDARQLVRENAGRKAGAVAGQRAGDGEIVLGVDTVVELDGRVLGKPADRERAAAMLRALAGRSHRVHSGVCVLEGERARDAVAVTTVTFTAISEGALEWYLNTGEWQGRAGAYAIQGRGAALIAAIEGDYLNVVGLPVSTLLQLLPSLLFPAVSQAGGRKSGAGQVHSR